MMNIRDKKIIGDCTLYLADCRDIHIDIDTIITDPPYGMSFQSNYRKTKYNKIENDGNLDLFNWVCDLDFRYSKYVFCRWDNLINIKNKPRSVITWLKNNHSMGDLNHEHGRKTELCLFYAGKEHKFNNKRPHDVIEAPLTGNKHHPTEKPVSLISEIVDWTIGTVYDPFMGSGTTGVACARLGRKFIGVELDENYYNIACQRILDECHQERLF